MEHIYLALQPFYRKYPYSISMKYRPDSDSTNTYKDDIGLKKTAYGGNLVLGYQAAFSRRFLVDTYAGLGFVIKEVENIDRQHDTYPRSCGPDGPPLPPFDLSESSGTHLNALLGIRIGYIL